MPFYIEHFDTLRSDHPMVLSPRWERRWISKTPPVLPHIGKDTKLGWFAWSRSYPWERYYNQPAQLAHFTDVTALATERLYFLRGSEVYTAEARHIFVEVR